VNGRFVGMRVVAWYVKEVCTGDRARNARDYSSRKKLGMSRIRRRVFLVNAAQSRQTQVGSPAREASMLGRAHQTRHDDDAPAPGPRVPEPRAWWSARAPAEQRAGIDPWAMRGLRVDYVCTTHAKVDRDRMRSARLRQRDRPIGPTPGLLPDREVREPSRDTEVASHKAARPGRQIFLLESRHVRSRKPSILRALGHDEARRVWSF